MKDTHKKLHFLSLSRVMTKTSSMKKKNIDDAKKGKYEMLKDTRSVESIILCSVSPEVFFASS